MVEEERDPITNELINWPVGESKFTRSQYNKFVTLGQQYLWNLESTKGRELEDVADAFRELDARPDAMDTTWPRNVPEPTVMDMLNAAIAAGSINRQQALQKLTEIRKLAGQRGQTAQRRSRAS